jgi:hypothetical protein
LFYNSRNKVGDSVVVGLCIYCKGTRAGSKRQKAEKLIVKKDGNRGCPGLAAA